MTPQELYDTAREWAKEGSSNAYIVLTRCAWEEEDDNNNCGEVSATYFDIACMLREIMRRDSRFRKVAKAVLQDLDEHPEDCINNQKTTSK